MTIYMYSFQIACTLHVLTEYIQFKTFSSNFFKIKNIPGNVLIKKTRLTYVLSRLTGKVLLTK